MLDNNYELRIAKLETTITKLEADRFSNDLLRRAQADRIDALTDKLNKANNKITVLDSIIAKLAPRERATRNNLHPESLNLTTAASRHGMKVVDFREALIRKNWIRREYLPSGPKNKATDFALQAGYLEVQSCQVFVTKAGMAHLERWGWTLNIA